MKTKRAFVFREKTKIWEFPCREDPDLTLYWVATWGRPPYPQNLAFPAPQAPQDLAYFHLRLKSWDQLRVEGEEWGLWVWCGKARDIRRVRAFMTKSGVVKVLYRGGGCLFNGHRAKSLPGVQLVES